MRVREEVASYAAGPDSVDPAPDERDAVDPAPDEHNLDALEELGDEIATLAAHIHAATHRLLTLIARFDRLEGWKNDGFPTCAHWLAFRTGVNLGAAREKVRAARALETLPRVSAAMSRGELSFAKVRALTRVATPDNETELLELARAGTAAGLEKVVRAWRRLNRLDEAELERVRHRSRCFSVFPDDDGMYVVRGRRRATRCTARARLPTGPRARSSRSSGGPTPWGFWRSVRWPREWGRKASRVRTRPSAAAAPSATRSCCTWSPPPSRPMESRAVRTSWTARAFISLRSKSSRMHTLSALRASRERPLGSAETSRRLACDSSRVRITRAPDGSVLDVGRRTRTIPPALRRALEVRDGGCRFPGCGSRFCDAHHIRHWADGGETKLSNSLLLCRVHHRLVHEQGYRVDFPEGGRPNFYDPRGRPLPDAPVPVHLGGEPTRMLERENRLHGARPDFRTCRNGHKRDDDVPGAVLLRTLHVLEGTAFDEPR